jgi:type II secretory pathway component GspD/PulD (secretin)
MALTTGIDCLRKGDIELAGTFFQQAKAGEDDLSPAERDELAKRLQYVEMALAARDDGTAKLQKAEDAAKAGRNQDALGLLKEVSANPHLRVADRQRAQKLLDEIQPRTAAAPTTATTGGTTPLLRARAMLKNARSLIAKGEYDAAESLAKEAKTLDVSYAPGEDTPQKVLDEVARGRTTKRDAKSLLAAARSALERGDLDAAERLAKESEKAESMWQMHLWGDSPAKVLKDVKDARTKVAANTKTGPKDTPKAPAKDASPTDTKAPAKADGSKTAFPEVAKGPAPKDSKDSKDAKDTKDVKTAASDKAKAMPPVVNLPAPPVRETDAVRALLRQGRKALGEGNYAEAEKLARQAKDKNADLNWWDDTPEKLLADIKRVSPETVATGTKAGTEKSKTATPAADTKVAQAKAEEPANDPRSLLRQARDHYQHGKLEEAKELALKANMAGVKWGLFEDSPDKLLAEIQAGRARRDKEESVRLLAEARKLFEQGKLDEAEKMAYQAERLHGSYSIWDLGDRPHKLVAEIQEVRAKNRRIKVPPPPVEVAKADGSREKLTPPAGTGPQGTAPAAGPSNPPQGDPTGTPPVAKGPANPPQGTSSVAQGASPLLGGPRATPVPPPAPDFAKQRAKQLLTECRELQKQGQLAAALQKAKEAQKVGAPFDAMDDRPDRAQMELTALAERQIENLKQAATDFASQGTGNPARYSQAESSLMQARELAIAFGLDLYPIDSTLVRLRQVQNPGTPAVAENPAVGGHLLPTSAQVAGKRDRGLQLLEQARMELKKGETGLARRIAEEAYNGKEYGVEADALALLRSIDAEEWRQKQLFLKRKVDAVVDAYKRKEFPQAKLLIEQIDLAELPPEQRQRLKGVMESPEMQPRQVAQSGPGRDGKVVQTVNTTTTGADNFASQLQAMQSVQWQKLHQEGIKARQQALELFGNGKTTEALNVLQDYKARIEDSGLEPERVTMLRRPIDSELQKYKTLKAQKDWEQVIKERNLTVLKGEERRALAEENKRQEVTRQMDQYKTFLKEGKYEDAVLVAMKAHELDPDNPATSAAMYTARILRNQARSNQARRNNSQHDFDDLNDASDMGPVVNTSEPMKVDRNRLELAGRRGAFNNITLSARKSEKEREIERRLNSPIFLDFKETPLSQVLNDLRAHTELNIIIDQPALDEDGISTDRPITMKLDGISTKSALNLLLHHVHLTYVIGDEVLKITTEKHARGKLVQKTFPVADLVIPVDNYIVAPSANLMHCLSRDPNQAQNVQVNGVTAVQSRNSLLGGQQVSTSMGSEHQPDHDGTGGAPQSLKAGMRAPGQTDTLHGLLIDLIKNAIKPETWADRGGKGTIDYFPLGMALVINQTPDVQEQVQDLLDALRRLQDLEVAVEVRMISLEEAFFERIGIDFQMNIKTDRITQGFEPQVVTQQFKPANFINDPFPRRVIAGVQPAGSGLSFSPSPMSALTPDLDIPIHNSSFSYAIPPFGAFPNIPGSNGGLSMGLAFLSDIQLFMFMEAAQGDRRTNIMQAPKLTLFNGQTATIQIQDFQWFVTNVQVVQNGGQVVFVPQNQPIPLGVNLAIQAVVSADRRFVRLNIAPTMSNLASATVPLFPVTTFIVPVFEGGAQGQPVPFTQFIQQPTLTTITIQTTVSVPDGGTVLLGGLKLMNEGRNEFGPPVLSKIPYLNRLFKNVGYGKDTSSLLLMVTPRIIINAEEEFLQTGVDSFGLFGGIPAR